VKRFEFRLARLAKVRRIEEERARAAWQSAEAAAREAEAAVQEGEREVQAAYTLLRQTQSDSQLTPLQVIAFHEAVSGLLRALTATRTEASRLAAEALAKREPWQAARTELEGLQRLEDKARQAHRVERERIENMEMDQLASERTARAETLTRRGATPRISPEVLPASTAS
jgi:flagellar export protein FliJ